MSKKDKYLVGLDIGSTKTCVLIAELADDQVCVVITLLRTTLKFAGAIEQLGDAGHTEGAEERQFQRAYCVERKVKPGAQEYDSLMSGVRVQLRSSHIGAAAITS